MFLPVVELETIQLMFEEKKVTVIDEQASISKKLKDVSCQNSGD